MAKCYLEDDDELKHSGETNVNFYTTSPQKSAGQLPSAREIIKATIQRPEKSTPAVNPYFFQNATRNMVNEISSVESGIRGFVARGCVRERLDRVNGAGTPI